LGLRVTPELKRRLDAVVEGGGRSQSQEAEMRLERSFEREGLLPEILELKFGRPAAGIILAIGCAVRDAARSYEIEHAREIETAPNWALDPDGFDLAADAAVAVLDMLRPEGARSVRPGQGRAFATRTRQAMADNPALSAVRREEGEVIRRLLGPITPTLKDVIGEAAETSNEEESAT
jgi:hypothetical protein